jgi:23S rRNA pseudouridine1911/1915/1917 synthase
MAENNQKIEIVYENERMLVINKPSGLVTTHDRQPNIEDWIKENRPNGLPREGLVHRLDKGTSGLLVIAKNMAELERLQALFKKRGVVKKYMALVPDKFPFEAEVNMPIGRSRYKFDCFAVKENGRPARTIFKRLNILRINNKIYSLVEADLKTGRTHQIRVHLKYLKYPIVGDKLYGGEEGLGNRIWLHSYYLEIDNLCLTAPLPVELDTIISNATKV